MSVLRTKTTNTNTHHINKALADPLRVSVIAALGHAELSLTELAELLNIDERLMAYHLQVLVHAGAVEEQHYGYHQTYVVTHPSLLQSSHILYELWAREATRSRGHAAVHL